MRALLDAHYFLLMDHPAQHPLYALSERHEEAASALTHGLGVLASVAGTAVLVGLATLHGDGRQLAGAVVFGLSLLALYTASTLYHAVRRELAKARLQIVDHCAIYVLIAGTYTPFTLGPLHGGWGWSLFGVIWGLALAGIVFKLFFTGRFTRLSTALYVAMGWLVLVAAGPLVRAVPIETLAWLFAGGVAYTAGTFFYLSRRVPFGHAVWHLFVLGGSACHFVAVFSIVGTG
ncbi:MAG TPA: hemolysin III family protein [Rhodothermales bacterium]|nr:hemolysin III family protein [Rhodothermales bacterium]